MPSSELRDGSYWVFWTPLTGRIKRLFSWFLWIPLFIILMRKLTGQGDPMLLVSGWPDGWCWQWCMTNDQLISWLLTAPRLPTRPILLSFRHKTIDQSLSSTNYLGPPHCTALPFHARRRPQCQLPGQNLCRSKPVWKLDSQLIWTFE